MSLQSSSAPCPTPVWPLCRPSVSRSRKLSGVIFAPHNAPTHAAAATCVLQALILLPLLRGNHGLVAVRVVPRLLVASVRRRLGCAIQPSFSVLACIGGAYPTRILHDDVAYPETWAAMLRSSCGARRLLLFRAFDPAATARVLFAGRCRRSAAKMQPCMAGQSNLGGMLHFWRIPPVARSGSYACGQFAFSPTFSTALLFSRPLQLVLSRCPRS